jgi:DNA polymerase-1
MENVDTKFLTPEETYTELIKLKGQIFAIDTETTGLEWWKDSLIGVSIYCPTLALNEYYFCCTYANKPTGRVKRTKTWKGEYEISAITRRKQKVWNITENQSTVLTAVGSRPHLEAVQRALQEIVADPNSFLIFHNYKFDAHFLGLSLRNKPCRIRDTSVLIHLFDSRLPKALGKAEVMFLGTQNKVQLQAPKGIKPWHWTPEVIREYAKNDAVVTYELIKVLTPKLRKLNLIPLLELQMEYLKVLQEIEAGGIYLDKKFCLQAFSAFEKNLKAMQTELYDSTGQVFNWRSPMQLSQAIYAGLGILKPKNPFADADGVDRSRMAHKGKYNQSATSSFLLMEKQKHPLGSLILDLREAAKMKSTVQKYAEQTDEQSFVHTNFNLSRTRTGRLSSSKPNMQNVASEHRVRETQSVYSGGAIRQDEYNLRTAFLAQPGYTFISIDMAQQEMRLFAILANEPIMMQALKERKDIHLMIAIAVWGDCGEERNKLHREWSKTIAFGLIYGMTAGSLQYRLNKTPEEANEITQQYWNTFPRIQPFISEVIQNMKKYGRVRYWSGRIWRENDEIKYYKGCNAQVQGGAADLISLAVIRSHHVLTYNGWGRVDSIIHDEILSEVKIEAVNEVLPILMRIMECEDVFGLPFRSEAKVGPSYGNLTKVPTPDTVITIQWEKYCDPTFDLTKYQLKPWTAGKI